MKKPSRAVLAVVLSSASLSLAQTSTPPPPPPAGAPVASESAPAPSLTPEEKPYQVGVRIGGSAGLGAWVPGMFSFHLFDLHGGVQVSPMFGAYLRVGYNASLGFGVSASPTGSASLSAAAAGMWLVGANAELGLGDSFFIAGGPQVGIGTWARTSLSASATGTGGSTTARAIVSQGAHPGLDLKIGFGLGQPNKVTKRRTQFTIALDVAMLVSTNVTDASATASGGTNGAGAGVSISAGEAIAIVPTLHLGFEWR